jgi:diguanylate cyclase (GGDEF)-like protein/PAS domain S-box-containing protein
MGTKKESLMGNERNMESSATESTCGIEIDWSIDSVANLSPALMWLARPDGRANYLSQKCLDFTGRTMEEEIGDGWLASVHPEDLASCAGKYIAAVQNRTAVDLEFRLKRKDGVYRWILDHVQPRYSESGEFLGFIGSCLDITELYEAKEQIERQRDELAFIVRHDHLTGAYARRYLFEQAEEEIKRAQRYGYSLYLIMMDVDRYKAINDTYGHNIGDQVLVALVDSLKKNVRSIDHVCRYAGDEFCVLLPDTDQAEVEIIAERIRKSVQDIKLPEALDLKFSVSLGLARYSALKPSVEEWISKADSALYISKQTGRNTVSVASN